MIGENADIVPAATENFNWFKISISSVHLRVRQELVDNIDNKIYNKHHSKYFTFYSIRIEEKREREIVLCKTKTPAAQKKTQDICSI